MQRWSRVLLTALLAPSTIGLTLIGSGGAASAAGACVTSPYHAWSGGYWNPSGTHFAAGVQAPIQLRTTSNICVAAPGNQGDQASSWIAIEPGSYTLIAQIGFVKLVDDPSTGSVKNCRFWAIGQGQVHAYACDADSAGDRVWFRIEAMPDPETQRGHYYFLEDCGPDVGYDSCVTKNAAQAAWTDGVAFENSEVTYPCEDQMAGSSSARVSFGTSSFPVKGQDGFGDTWSTRTQSGTLNGSCTTHFHYAVTNTIIDTWDDRN